MKFIKVLFPFIGILFFYSPIHAQNLKVEWGDFQRSFANSRYIIPNSGSNFYTLKTKYRGIFGKSMFITKHEDFQNVKFEKLDLKVNNSFAQFEGVLCLNGELIVFLSDRDRENNFLFLKRFNKDLLPIGEPIELASYAFSSQKNEGLFDVVKSDDGSHFGVIWVIPGKKDEKVRYGYKIFKSSMEEISTGEYKLPFEPEMATIRKQYLSNTGDYFITVTEYQEGEKRLLKKDRVFKSIHVFHIMPDDFDDIEIDLKGHRTDNVVINSDNDRYFTIAGLYGDENSSNVLGLFYVKADFKEKKVLEERFEKFDEDFITKGWSERRLSKAESRRRRGKGDPQLFNYIIRNCELLDDGSLIGSFEQYFVVEITTSDPRSGNMETSRVYHYNDVVVFKINPDGGFDWLRKIPKQQESTDDGGYYSSYSHFLFNGKYTLIFNDHERNYSDGGEFIEQNFSTTFKRNRTASAVVSIDVENGDVKRELLSGDSSPEGTIVPKKFIFDTVHRELLLYAISGKKEKFGMIRFD